MSTEEVSPGKFEPLRDRDFHYHTITGIETAFAQKGFDLSAAWYEASIDLDKESLKALAVRLKCSSATRTKYIKGGAFFVRLSKEKKELMPDSATTLYAIAVASEELRDKAFNEGVINKCLTRESWNDWARKNRVRRETPKTLLRIYRPQDQTREEALLEAAKKWASDNSVEIDITGAKTSKKKASVKDQILAIAMQNPAMPVEELIRVLDLQDAA